MAYYIINYYIINYNNLIINFVAHLMKGEENLLRERK